MQRTKTKNIKDKIGLKLYYDIMLLPYDSEPTKPSTVKSEVNFLELSEDVKTVIMDFPLVKFTGRFDYGGLDKKQQFYIMTTLKENFIVDTQGNNYARYVCRLKNLSGLDHKDVEAIFHSNEDIKMIKRSEYFKVVYNDVEYKIEITEDDEDTFTSVEYNGNYLMDSKLESEIIGYFNQHR